MIRIKVVKASRLALWAVVGILAIALAILLIRFAVASGGEKPVSVNMNASAGEMTEMAADVAAFSVASMSSPIDILISSGGDDEIHENEHTDDESGIKIEVIDSEPPEPSASPDQPPPTGEDEPVSTGEPLKLQKPYTVLIYHTHTHEAYEQVEDDPYVAVSQWRTADQSHSIVRVGEVLAELLRSRGFEVTHDTTDHEPPKLGTAYVRSLETLESYDEKFDLYIDLHRDAYSQSGGEPMTVEVGGQQAARLMMLIGSAEGFNVKPDFQENYGFALMLTDKLNSMAPGICKDVMVKTNRYNQHIGTPAILIEVGHNKNTLEQAVASMPYLADSLTEVVAGAGGAGE